MDQAKKHPTTLINTEVNCKDCNDTTWIRTELGTYKRCNCYSQGQLKRLWSNFGLDVDKVKKLNDYKPYDEITIKAKEKAVEYVKDFKNESMALLGQPGAGKTHIVVAIGAALLNKNIRVVYMPYLEVMMELKSNARDEEYYTKVVNKYLKADLLIIDDLFKDKVKNGQLLKVNGYPVGLTEADMKHIYRILNVRYNNHKPILVSSECTPEMLLNLDEALARRILEPCEDNIIIFEGKHHNYSMRKYGNEK